VPEGIVSGTAITTPVPCSPQHDASRVDFGWTIVPVRQLWTLPLSSMGMPEVGFWTGAN